MGCIAVTFTLVPALVACSGSDQPSAATAVVTPSTSVTEPTTPATSATATDTASAGSETGSATGGETGTGTDEPGATTTDPEGGGGGNDDDNGNDDNGNDDGGNGGNDGGNGNGGDDGSGASWEAVESLPSEAYPAFAGANWSGRPSPALAADAATLAPGVYHAARTGDGAADVAIALTIRRFEACTVSPAECVTYEGEEIPPEDIVPTGTALPLDLALDASLRVGVAGVDCQADNQLATGAELAAMMRQFDADYAAAIAGVPRAAIDRNDVDAITAALLASPSGRFEAPDCFEGAFPPGTIRWRGDTGPGVLLQTPLAADGDGGVAVPASASAVWIRPTALEVGADGSRTLFLDAGFVA